MIYSTILYLSSNSGFGTWAPAQWYDLFTTGWFHYNHLLHKSQFKVFAVETNWNLILHRLAIERMAVGGGLIVITDRCFFIWFFSDSLDPKYTTFSKREQMISFYKMWSRSLFEKNRANMIFAFCLESCLDTRLPLVIRSQSFSPKFSLIPWLPATSM